MRKNCAALLSAGSHQLKPYMPPRDPGLAKDEDALIGGSVEYMFSNVGIVEEATDDEVKTNDEEGQSPEPKKRAWIVAIAALEGRHPNERIP